MKRLSLFVLFLSVLSNDIYSQQYIENLVLEKYYVADQADAEDPFSGGLNPADTTFRVFVDLCEGCKLLGMFGDENHLLEISSTEPFYNNDLGQTFGHQISPNFLNISTIGIDSYLSMGGASSNNLAVLKSADNDGSIWPNGTTTGLLVNNDPAMNIPLSEQDGLVPLPDSLTSSVPPGFTVQPQEAGAPAYVTSVFGTQSDSSLFTSAYFETLTIRSNQGMFGADESNHIMLGQFTTAGELSFEFNLILFVPGQGQVRVVASNENLQPGEVVSAFLKYPPECGCTDPDYLEYSPSAPCDDGSCQELIVFGCTDPEACNYNEDANFNVQSLCCYSVDDCGQLDPALICEGLNTEFENADLLKIYPNPVHDILNIQFNQSLHSQPGKLIIFNSSGVQTIVKILESGQKNTRFNINQLANGIYQVVLIYPDATISRKIIVQH